MKSTSQYAKEVKTCYRCKCSRPRTEFAARESSSDGLRSECRDCAKAIYREWYARTKRDRGELNRQRTAARRALPGGAEKNRADALKWYHDNPDNALRAKERARAWSAANPDRKRAADRAWRTLNRARMNAHVKAYKARKLKATPAWANTFFLEEAYDLAALRTAMTGFEWHVDHIVPLRGRTVCGLHVEHNVQVIPKRLNLQKGNRYWPDMP